MASTERRAVFSKPCKRTVSQRGPQTSPSTGCKGCTKRVGGGPSLAKGLQESLHVVGTGPPKPRFGQGHSVGYDRASNCGSLAPRAPQGATLHSRFHMPDPQQPFLGAPNTGTREGLLLKVDQHGNEGRAALEGRQSAPSQPPRASERLHSCTIQPNRSSATV